MKKKKSSGSVFGYEGPFFTWGSKAFDLMLLSVYWVIGCLPVVTVGASAAALFRAVDRCVIEDRGSVTETFWHAYRQNLKMGSLHWLLLFGLSFLFLLNFGICRANMSGQMRWFFCALYLVLTAAVVICCCYIFPLISMYDMPFSWYTKGALYSILRHIPVSLLCLGMVAAGYYSVLKFPLTVLFIPGLYSAITVPLVKKRIEVFEDINRTETSQEAGMEEHGTDGCDEE